MEFHSAVVHWEPDVYNLKIRKTKVRTHDLTA